MISSTSSSSTTSTTIVYTSTSSPITFKLVNNKRKRPTVPESLCASSMTSTATTSSSASALPPPRHQRQRSLANLSLTALPRPTIDIKPTSNKKRPGSSSGSRSAPSSPRPIKEPGEGWYFTPSVTPVVVPTTPSSSPRTRKRSTGARSVPGSPKRSPSSPSLHRDSNMSASTSAMPSYHYPHPHSASSPYVSMTSYPQAPMYASMVDSLGLHSRRTYDDDSDGDDEDAMFVRGGHRRHSMPRPGTRSRQHSSASLKARPTTTTSETEGEFTRPLPTSRIPSSQLQQAPTTSNLIVLRWLSVLGPYYGAFFHLSSLLHSNPPSARIDHFICTIWALFAAYQNLSFTTGLLHRWTLLYPNPISVFIRLLALQIGICLPAMTLTYRLFNHSQSPLLCWTLIGTTTAVSKAIQMWATSNLRGGIDDDDAKPITRPTTPSNALLLEPEPITTTTTSTFNAYLDHFLDILQTTADLIVPGGTSDVIRPRSNSNPNPNPTSTRKAVKRGGGGARKWNWSKVWRKCGAPAAGIYVLMAWGLLLNRELMGGC